MNKKLLKIIVGICVLIVGLLTSNVNQEQSQSEVKSGSVTTYKVSSIVDGDTFKAIAPNGKIETVRLVGIDTPETKDPAKPEQCFGKEATAKLTDLIAEKEVKLTLDDLQPAYDRYDRILAYVYLADGTNVNDYMVRNGYAFVYTKAESTQSDRFKEAQESAKKSGLGLWSACNY